LGAAVVLPPESVDGVVVRIARKLLAVSGAAALSLLVMGAPPADAATGPSGGYADAKGIVVDLTVLSPQIGLPGPLGGTPLDPNTFANSSQACLPNAGKDAPDTFLNVPAAPAATAAAVDTLASAKCNAVDAVASAAAQTVGLKALFNGAAPTITADVIRAQANSDCTKAPNAAGSVFQNVVIGGQAIPDLLALNTPNRVIPLPGIGSVILNEQHPTADGRGIVVNGLHVIGSGPLVRGDLIISHAVSGVVCTDGGPGGPGKGSDFTGVPGAKPEITFAKDASPSTAKAGDTVTYTSTVRNVSTSDCDVLRFFDHLDPVFDIVSTDGAFGKVITPADKRQDGGTDVLLKPTGLTIGAGKSVSQTFVVKLKDTVQPGTYYNNLELFCAVNGDFASGPLAPVTVPAAAPPVAAPPAVAPPAALPEQLPRTGATPLVAASALLLLLAGIGIRRSLTT
jgi:uncharacterized repeat protein (TIGR01451 family)